MNLDELKVGDEIVLYTGRELQLNKVLRVTPKQIIVAWYTGAEMPFSKETGRGIGNWKEKEIFIATPEKKEQTACEAMYRKLYEKKLFVHSHDYKLIREVFEFLYERKLIS